MTATQLPERPNLEQLKRQAKDLLHAARAHDAKQGDALARFRILPSFSRASVAELAHAPLALHDAQSVIAREHGFDSWNALRERVEELTLEFGAAVDQFIHAATDARPDRAERLLALHPAIAKANLYTALVLGDAAAVDARLAASPMAATQPGGPRDWQPLHYLCHSAIAKSRGAELATIARRLIELGADPNLRFPWFHHGVQRPVLWGAVIATGSLTLADALLRAGANPNDGVTLPLAAGSANIDALELLAAHGADVNQGWASDGGATLYEILHWAAKPDGAIWLLEHGADPDPVFPANGETPLHVVAAKWRVDLAEHLVRRGADVRRRRADGRTPYAVARLNGNAAVAEWLVAHGSPAELSDVDRLVAACRRGDRELVNAMLQAQPELRNEIAPEHYGAFYQATEHNDTAALELMLECGFDPNRPDESIGKTALHVAAMEGNAEAARLLLANGASVSVRDREFRAPPLIWAAEGSLSSKRAGRDHAAVGRLLLDAGSPVEWESGPEPAESILDVVDAWRAAAMA